MPTSLEDEKLYRLIMDYCLRILGRKQYSVSELTKKIKFKLERLKKYSKTLPVSREALKNDDDKPGRVFQSFPKEDIIIAQVLGRLQEWNYLSDAKIIEHSIEAIKNYKPQGKIAFVASMLKKGISPLQAKEAWNTAEIDEEELAREVIKKYIPKYKSLDRNERKRKLAQVLARKGFGGDIVWSAIDELS